MIDTIIKILLIILSIVQILLLLHLFYYNYKQYQSEKKFWKDISEIIKHHSISESSNISLPQNKLNK